MVDPRIAFVGFGEAGIALATGMRSERPALRISAYDIKTASADATTRRKKLEEYRTAGVDGALGLDSALASADIVVCAVTSDQAVVATTDAARSLPAGVLYLDINSCAPRTKTLCAETVVRAGGRYVDVAVMAPILPKRHRTPLLVAGPDAREALPILESLGMVATLAGDSIGAAAAVKMTRSIMVKGLEALMVECVLAASEGGVSEAVFQSLEESFPNFKWREKAAYMLERAISHGLRRAAELEEVSNMLDQLGVGSTMSRATAIRQREIGALRLNVDDIDEPTYQALVSAILASTDWRRTHGDSRAG